MIPREDFNLKKFLIFTGLTIVILASLVLGLQLENPAGMRVEASTL